MPTRTWELPAGRRRFTSAATLGGIAVAIAVVAVAGSIGAPIPFVVVFAVAAAAITAYNLWVLRFRVVWVAQLKGTRLSVRGPRTAWTGDLDEVAGVGRSWIQGNQAYLVTPRGRLWIHPLLPDALGLLAAIRAQRPDLPTRGPA